MLLSSDDSPEARKERLIGDVYDPNYLTVDQGEENDTDSSAVPIDGTAYTNKATGDHFIADEDKTDEGSLSQDTSAIASIEITNNFRHLSYSS